MKSLFAITRPVEMLAAKRARLCTRIVLLASCLIFGIGPAHAQPLELRGGWSPGLPYQFENTRQGSETLLTGLDIEIVRSISREAGFRAVFKEVPWEENLEAVRLGELDFALAAPPMDGQRKWAWFSAPYREEAIAIFVRRGELGRLVEQSPIETLKRLLADGKPIGVIRGDYHGPDVAELLAQPDSSAQILRLDDEARLLDALVMGSVDAILADRLAIAGTAGQTEALFQLEIVPGILYEVPVCIMFSKASTSESTVEAFDAALEQMRSSGELAVITRHYLVPQLLLITMKTPWFVAFDMIGTIAFAISGVLIARRERYDIIGACVLAALPAVGGGIMRDMITSRSPIGIVQTPMLLFLVLGTVLAGTLFYFLHDWIFGTNVGRSNDQRAFCWRSNRGALEVFDAIGLATFTIIGVMVAIEQRCEPLWLWGPVLGALTAAGGGVLRDVLCSKSDIPTLKGSIYPEIAIFWAWIYSLVIMSRGHDLTLREVLQLTIIVMLAAFITRILVVQFGMKSIFLGFENKGSSRDSDQASSAK